MKLIKMKLDFSYQKVSSSQKLLKSFKSVTKSYTTKVTLGNQQVFRSEYSTISDTDLDLKVQPN